MKPPVAQPELNCTDAQNRLVVDMRDSRGTQMCGPYYSQGGVGLVNGQIASACYAEQLGVV